MVEFVLNVEYLTFTASLNKSDVSLKWTVLNKELIRSYVIERSIDGLVYEPVKLIDGTGLVNAIEYYHSIDQVQLLKNNRIFYRIKSTGISGRVKYSCVVSIVKSNAQTSVEVVPNPVRGNLKLFLNVPHNLVAMIRIIDVSGRIIINQMHRLNNGSNSIIIPQSSGLHNGLYTIQVVFEDEIHSRNFIVQH
jgi:hypothetical protein